MLDVETKSRINTARDILVGKVPDPKSQVEQITIALIYKFMDDMDVESEELGGKRTFFVGDYAKYAWRKIFDPRQGGHELLNLYSEAIAKMDTNPGIPKLFRDIFKNAYLPYRDPETLKSFLKIINEFDYSHSEKLGDAFEFLLSILGSQGDAGQFRTPRHIIDFMVEIMDPKKHEVILDPACGTAGFLISSYKHIIKQNSSNYLPGDNNKVSGNGTETVNEVIISSNGYSGDKLSADERKVLADNMHGYDISPDMVRLSLVNMYLHGIKEPKIYEYDTLTSEDYWHQYSDVILANPPFMSPKGGIRPHKRFSVQSNRSEVLFVDYIAEHLTPDGRAAVIVPEGIIFQSGSAYKELRKMLVDHYLVGVISLPSGVFNPYTQVKTSILLLDKVLSKKTDAVLFLKIEKDGTDLGAKRIIIGENDLPIAKAILRSFIESIITKKSFSSEAIYPRTLQIVKKSSIYYENSYSFSIDRYRTDTKLLTNQWELVKLCDFCLIEKGKSSSTKTLPGDYPLVLTAKERKTSDHFDFDGESVLIPLISSTGHGKASLKTIHIQKGKFAAADLLGVVFPDKSKCLPDFLFLYLDAKKDEIAKRKMVGSANVSMKLYNLDDIEVPLPPLSFQKELISEIDSYQKIIDGARQVVENYKPRINIDPNWEMVELGEVCATSSGGTPLKNKPEYYNGSIPWLKSGEVAQGYIYSVEETITELGLKNSSCKLFPKDTVLVAMYGATAGKVGLLKVESTTNQAVCGILPNGNYVPEFLYYYLLSQTDFLISQSTGGAQPNISQTIIKKLKIPVVPIEIQQQIVNMILEEKSHVDSSNHLIGIFEQKIKDRIAKVWGE
jgi:type I restriction enzyme M protein